MPMNEEGRPRGIAFITYTSKAGVDAALKFDGDDYGGRTLRVNIAAAKGKGDKGKGKGDKGKGKGNREFEVFVKGFANDTEDDALRKMFEKCGDIETLRVPRWDDGGAKGMGFVCFKDQDAVDKALKLNGNTLGESELLVEKAGQGKGDKGKGKGKDGKGDKGKGKGKDGKGKKGKGKATTQQTAARDGSMVESTGKKQTFNDSDDDDEDEAPPPPKKAKKKAPVEEDDDDDE